MKSINTSPQKRAVHVGVRIKPSLQDEASHDVAWCEDEIKCNSIKEMDTTVKSRCSKKLNNFAFENVFGPRCTNADVFKRMALNIVKEATLKGYNATCFAYGQTSSGKTHTMMGSKKSPGVIPLAIKILFQSLDSNPDIEYHVDASYLEIYKEIIQDLLRSKVPHKQKPEKCNTGNPVHSPLEIHEHRRLGPFVKGLSHHPVTNAEQTLSLIHKGEMRRHVGRTDMNAVSSRSHTVFKLRVEKCRKQRNGSTNCPHHHRRRSIHGIERAHPLAIAVSKRQQKGIIWSSELNFVDLAGSERVSKTHARGIRLKEAGYINQSLMTLGKVISILSSKRGQSRFLPLRDSKLTRLLSTSLGGNSITSLICCISPLSSNREETRSTLMFAARAKHVVNKIKSNTVAEVNSMLAKYKEEATKLRTELTALRAKYLEDTNINAHAQINKEKKLAQKSEKLQIETESLRLKCKKLEEAAKKEHVAAQNKVTQIEAILKKKQKHFLSEEEKIRKLLYEQRNLQQKLSKKEQERQQDRIQCVNALAEVDEVRKQNNKIAEKLFAQSKIVKAKDAITRALIMRLDLAKGFAMAEKRKEKHMESIVRQNRETLKKKDQSIHQLEQTLYHLKYKLRQSKEFNFNLAKKIKEEALTINEDGVSLPNDIDVASAVKILLKRNRSLFIKNEELVECIKKTSNQIQENMQMRSDIDAKINNLYIRDSLMSKLNCIGAKQKLYYLNQIHQLRNAVKILRQKESYYSTFVNTKISASSNICFHKCFESNNKFLLSKSIQSIKRGILDFETKTIRSLQTFIDKIRSLDSISKRIRKRLRHFRVRCDYFRYVRTFEKLFHALRISEDMLNRLDHENKMLRFDQNKKLVEIKAKQEKYILLVTEEMKKLKKKKFECITVRVKNWQAGDISIDRLRDHYNSAYRMEASSKKSRNTLCIENGIICKPHRAKHCKAKSLTLNYPIKNILSQLRNVDTIYALSRVIPEIVFTLLKSEFTLLHSQYFIYENDFPCDFQAFNKVHYSAFRKCTYEKVGNCVDAHKQGSNICFEDSEFPASHTSLSMASFLFRKAAQKLNAPLSSLRSVVNCPIRHPISNNVVGIFLVGCTGKTFGDRHVNHIYSLGKYISMLVISRIVRSSYNTVYL